MKENGHGLEDGTALNQLLTAYADLLLLKDQGKVIQPLLDKAMQDIKDEVKKESSLGKKYISNTDELGR
jgi:hypothetical protein